MKTLIALLLAAFVAGAAADAANPNLPRELRFAKGKTSVTVNGAVIRGERQVWRFGAREGQQAILKVSAVENNAAIEVWQPGATLPADWTIGDVEGRPLPGAAPGDDATGWNGTLPASGDYLVVVGPTRGNATYRLTLTIKP
jgi:hypothetical protein